MGEIRIANKNDLEQIKTWLEEEVNEEVGFYYNFDLIEEHFNNNLLFIYSQNNSTIGFITGRLESPSIVNVKKDFRGNGIGTKLYSYLEKKSKENDVCVINVLCKPKTSISFWKKMGFEIIKSKKYVEYLEGFKILNYNLVVPNGELVKVEISSYSEEVLYISNLEKNIHQIKKIILEGIQKENTIYFNKRIIIPSYNMDKDLVLRIKINDIEIFFDKAKQNKAEDLGIIKNNYSFYIDKLNIEKNKK